jgi:pimeloyl-[acyl-carrier protein] methyl ester esterase
VHRPNLPGYGSAPACFPCTLDALARAVAHAAPRRCHVVGWSLGGEVALAWARRAPRQVARLALIATTPCFTRRPGWQCASGSGAVREFERSLFADRDGTMARFIGAQGKGDSRRSRIAGTLERAAAADASDDVLSAGLAVLSAADLRRDLARVQQPALVMHGAHDRVVPAGAGRRLAAALPCARFCLFRSCAHAPFLSQPRRTAALLRKFLDG